MHRQETHERQGQTDNWSQGVSYGVSSVPRSPDTGHCATAAGRGAPTESVRDRTVCAQCVCQNKQSLI